MAGPQDAIEWVDAGKGATTQQQDGEGDIWLDVPYVRQPEEGCGAACLSMILRYWADKGSCRVSESDTDPQAIANILYTPPLRGIPGMKMQGYLHERGFQAFVFAASFSDLAHHLRQGRPLIVCVKPDPHQTSLHYLVVAGFDPVAEIVLVNDPARRKLLKLTLKNFEKAWKSTQHWTLLAVPESSGRVNPHSAP